MKAYKKRIGDAVLERKLSVKGAVLIEGPKWCGKTTTAKQIAKSILDLGSRSILEKSKSLIDIAPKELLAGETPRLIDEWQTIIPLWDEVRHEVDCRSEAGQFILTGSSVPVDFDKTIHSGTGRITRMKMRTMSLYESGESTGEISIGQLFDNEQFAVKVTDMGLEKLAYLTCRGGWPEASMMSGASALDHAFDYYDAVVTTDIKRVDGVNRSTDRARLLMRSYARNIAQQVPFSTMRSDMVSNDKGTLNEDTVIDYVNAFRKIFVIEDLPAWNPNLRSKSAIRTTDTRHFVDPSIATAALGLGPADLLDDLETFGLLFESMAVRDLRVYAEAHDANVYHYRDSSGLECDAVFHRRNGSYGLIEVKLGGVNAIEEAAKNLLALANKIDTTKMKESSFLMVVTGVGEYAYRRKDGIYVVPIGCLKP